MIRNIIVGLGALLLTSGALASDWRMNTQGIPVVPEATTDTKALGLFACIPGALNPRLGLADAGYPADAEGRNIAFKARIDKGAIYDITSQITDLGNGLLGVYINVEGEAITELMNGRWIRFQFTDSNGRTLVEKYSLLGFTKLFTTAALECANNAEPSEDHFFDESVTPRDPKDSDYF